MLNVELLVIHLCVSVLAIIQEIPLLNVHPDHVRILIFIHYHIIIVYPLFTEKKRLESESLILYIFLANNLFFNSNIISLIF